MERFIESCLLECKVFDHHQLVIDLTENLIHLENQKLTELNIYKDKNWKFNKQSFKKNYTK